MNFVVGSLSKRKLESVERVLKDILIDEHFTIKGYDALSSVPTTPWDKETFDGAQNRALDCKRHIQADYYIGIESGGVTRYGHIFEEAWCCIVDKKNNKYYGYSSGLTVPNVILKEMTDNNLKHYEVINKLKMLHDIKTDSNNTWGFYSAEKIMRETSLEEAIRNAVIQIFAPQDSLYNK